MLQNTLAKFEWKRFWAPIDIQVYEQGFLIDPADFLGNKQIVTIDKILEIDISCLILLGNPGLGKSHAIRDMYSDLKQAGLRCLFYDFLEYSSFQSLASELETENIFQEWLHGDGLFYLFLDSLDEGQQEIKKLEYELSRYLMKLPHERLRLFITCRSADLPPNFSTLMKSIWPDKDGLVSDVLIYQLAQLREQDAYIAAKMILGIEADNFLDAVYKTKAEVFASHPVTLNMLLRIFMNRKTLPNNRKDIYELGCKELISNSGSRDLNELFKLASQIGVLSIVSNRHRLYRGSDYQFEANVLNLRDMFRPEQEIQNPESLVNSVLQTALFVSSGNNHHFFAHRTYGEYLAALGLSQQSITLEQIKNLFINPVDPDRKIAPKLSETAAWLAVMRSDVFEWLMESQPSVLVHSDSVELANSQKAQLVQYFVQQYDTVGPIEDRLGWNGFQRLVYPELGIQLATYLKDSNLLNRAKELAMQFVVYCNITTIDHALIEIALDVNMTISLRVGALTALAKPPRADQEISKLRILLTKSSEYAVDRYVYKRTIEVLWPKYMSAEELFSNLYLPSFKELSFGSPDDELLNNLLLENLNIEDLPIALDWVAKNSQESDTSLTHSAQEFLAKIMQLAWDNLESEKVKRGFARAAWQRLFHYNPVIQARIPYFYELNQTIRDYEAESTNNAEKRHQLLATMLEVLTPEGLLDQSVLDFLLHSHHAQLSFIIPDDIVWLLEQTQAQTDPDKSKAYAYLAKITVFSTEEATLESIYFDYASREDHSLANYLRGLMEQSIALKRDRANERKRYDRKWRETQDLKRVSVEEIVRNQIAECKSSFHNWYNLTVALLTGDYGGVRSLEWDLRRANGWKYIENDAQAVGEVLVAAVQFIRNYQPSKNDKNTRDYPIDDPLAEAGYRALLLLAALDQLNQISPRQWKKWSRVIFSITPHYSSELRVLDDKLLQNASFHAEDIALKLTIKLVNTKSENYRVDSLLRRYKYIQSDKFISLLLELIEGLPITSRNFFILFSYLARNNKSIRQTQELVSKRFTNLKPEESKYSVLLAAKMIQYSTDNYWWPILYPYLQSNSHFVDLVFDILATNGEWLDRTYLQYLTATQLFELYNLSIEVNPYSSDRDFHGGSVPYWYTRQEWRDAILNELTNRGTDESLRLLNHVYSESPETPNIEYLIEAAHYKFRLESWEAPDPKDILQLLANSKQHYVRNASQLSALIIRLIQDIEQDFRGTAPMQRMLWDKIAVGNWQPVEEEAFSDAIAHWLKSCTSSLIVNREVEVRKDTTKPKGERTDIIVEAVSDYQDRLIVIIEVKACWFRDLYERVQTQLVDQYISPHPDCNHGIYLVGHFASPFWKTNPKQKSCQSQDKITLEIRLQETVTRLSFSKPTVISSIVFDASLAAEQE